MQKELVFLTILFMFCLLFVSYATNDVESEGKMSEMQSKYCQNIIDEVDESCADVADCHLQFIPDGGYSPRKAAEYEKCLSPRYAVTIEYRPSKPRETAINVHKMPEKMLKSNRLIFRR